MLYLMETAFLVTILAFFSMISFRKKLLDNGGILIANLVGLAIFFLGGFSFFLLAVLFFAVAEASTKFAAKKKPVLHDKRTIGNILGNSGAAIIALCLNSHIAFFGAISAALADTLSSELGMLSKKKPVLITSLAQVEPGTDGGVTGLGMWSALMGASIIATIHFVLNQNIFLFLCLMLAGFFGSVTDSFFGAIFERNSAFGNTEVNFLGSSAGALLVFLLSVAL